MMSVSQLPERFSESLRSLGRFLRRRAVAGFARSRAAVMPAATSAIAAVAAYAFASVVLGHTNPLFASTATLIALGFGGDTRLRKVLEIAIGCTLGILIGDLMQIFLGQGYLQALLVVFVSIIIARFLDNGVIFTTQMSLQAVLVVLLPLPEGGPFTRSLDAVVGGVFALVITMIMPKNLRGATVKDFNTLYSTVTEIFQNCSKALRAQDSREAWMTLVAARNTQTQMNAVHQSLRASQELATYSPTAKTSRELLAGTQDTAAKTDLALGSLRLVTRRLITVIDESSLTNEQFTDLADWFDEAAEAVAIMGRCLSEPALPGRRRSLAVAREAFVSATQRLVPSDLAGGDLQAEALVMLARPMMVDFIQATGVPEREASEFLPKL
ncbi:FUSC family protein [Auritidibacter ignavus]|uniref:FUSC family protein n=1 Tax=Auritidibacter ignavus TaxID=678932 RepID=UPI000F044A3F|nr:FUSC family protein [Auritidibacter ignavus]NIH72164.1 uncharacterized membrane protein YgaE (UPF0421/DUF939 family) [Auritidibacter ignavus]RMX21893.1 FUSC family protein [Auritidibacter ignavus]